MKDLNIKIYSDGADIEDMVQRDVSNDVDGFTTNPTLMAKDGVTDYIEFAKEALSKIKEKSISFEVFSDDIEDMYRQAIILRDLGENVYVKIPVSNTKKEMTYDLIKRLSSEGVKLNVTAIFTIEQIEKVYEALNKNIPAIISIFSGRIANAGIDPEPFIKHAVSLAKDTPCIEILWASSREVFNLIQAERCGCHIITMAPSLLNAANKELGKDLAQFSLETVEMFYKDANNAGYNF
tara:strand:- start:14504 stop:15214 length:711 start_codon:yes stop_codon:yes gene_type:complete